MKKKYSILLILLLLITCSGSSIFIKTYGSNSGASYTFSEDDYRLIDRSALTFTLFVSPDGSDSNPGTEDRPFKTIGRAALKAQAGDTVLVRRGTYKENVDFENSGTWEHPILFVAEEGTVVVGSEDMSRWDGVLRIHDRRYITLSGFHVNNSNWFGIMVDDSSHIIVDSCFVENTEASGIMAWGSDHVLIINNRVRNTCAYDGDPPGLGAQECISVSDADTFQVLYNEVYESSSGFAGGEGIDAKGGCRQGEIAYNLVHDNIRLGIYVDSYASLLSNVSVHNNVVYRSFQGIAVSSEAGGTARDVRIYNNLVFNNTDNGIIVGGWCDNGPRENISIFSNTVVNNGGPYGGGIGIQADANAYGVTIRNNIVSGNYFFQIMADHPDKGIICEHNLINGFKGLDWTCETRGANYQEGDPGFVISETTSQDPFIIRAIEYTLRSDSIAIDSGSSIGAPPRDILNNERPQGSEFDIGAIEYTETPGDWARTHNFEETIWDWTPEQVHEDTLWDWSWTSLTDMPTPRDSISAAAMDGRIYVLGGTKLEEYNPTTDTWRPRKDIPIRRWELETAVLDGKIYAIGGRDWNDDSDLTTVEVYDPSTDTWTTRTPMQTARHSHAAVEADGKIYVFGGFDEDWNTLDSVEEYDPATDTWTSRTPMPIPTTVDAVTIGENIYVAGDSWGKMMKYDVTADTWAFLTPKPTSRTLVDATVIDGRLYIIGGRDSDEEPLAVVEEYDPDTDTWKVRPPMPTARTGLAAVSLDGRLYVFGGRSDEDLATVEVFGPPVEDVPNDTDSSDTSNDDDTITNTPPEADFTFSPYSPKIGETVQFTDRSEDPDGDYLRYHWDFGDYSSSTTGDPHHIYSSSGDMWVTLTVLDSEGAEDVAMKRISVEALRPAEFKVSDLDIEPDSVFIGEEVTVTAVCTNVGEESGDCSLVLLINGEDMDDYDVSLDPGESETITFEFLGEDTGTHMVDVGGLSGSFSVKRKGIPGFPTFSIAIGMLLGALLLELHRYKVRI